MKSSIHILEKSPSLASVYLAEMRDAVIQQDSMRFRRNMERMGEIFAYEISKSLDYEPAEVVTSLGTAQAQLLKAQPVLATILRAGLPLHQGLLNFFDKAENAFISAFRKHHKNGRFDIQVEYVSSPDIDDKVLIIIDPMLATGASMVLAWKELLCKGTPRHTHVVSIVASLEGVEYIRRHMGGSPVSLWLGAIDDELTAKAYIVPGLGDAGDLAFGSKT